MKSGTGYRVSGTGLKKPIVTASRGSILLLFFLLFGCNEESKVAPGTTSGLGERDNPSQISYATTMNFTNEGMLRATMWAGRIRTYDSKRMTLLDSTIHVDFFDRAGKHSSVLTAKRAQILDVTKNMTAYDSVHIVSDSGTVVDTDSLVWDNSRQTLHSEAHVRIVEKNGRITTGIGFESDQSLTNYSILRPNIQTPSSALQSGRTNAMPSTPAPPTLSPTAPSSPFGLPQKEVVPQVDSSVQR
jgi:LPS export ABC transporter protein LptC